MPVTSVPSPSSQYADDTTLHANNSQDVEQLVCNCEQYLLKITCNSTNLKPNILPSIKKTILGNLLKLLGSLLGSMEDVAARINAANSVKSHPREISKRVGSLASCFARKHIQVQYSITSSQSTHKFDIKSFTSSSITSTTTTFIHKVQRYKPRTKTPTKEQNGDK